MLLIFAIQKKFHGHCSVIQKNAINSWLNLEPQPQIILFGNENGTEEVCNKLGLIHIPVVKKNEYGTPLISDIFEQAQAVSVGDILCYANCLIRLLDDNQLRMKMSENCRVIALNEYKIEYEASKYVELFEELLSTEKTLH
jgi:glycosyltransferase involved in cell wall biosynthesis